MKYFIIIILMLSTSIYSQDIYKLDEKFGFKTIKLGTDYNFFKTNLKATESFSIKSMNAYEYFPVDNDLFYLFDTKMDKIILLFDKSNNKLGAIFLMKFYSANNFENHYDFANNVMLENAKKLITLFGNPTSVIKEEQTSDTGLKWKGDKTEMNILSSYRGLDNGTTIYVSLFDLSAINSSLNKGF